MAQFLQDNMFEWWHSFYKLAKGTLISQYIVMKIVVNLKWEKRSSQQHKLRKSSYYENHQTGKMLEICLTTTSKNVYLTHLLSLSNNITFTTFDVFRNSEESMHVKQTFLGVVARQIFDIFLPFNDFHRRMKYSKSTNVYLIKKSIFNLFEWYLLVQDEQTELVM